MAYKASPFSIAKLSLKLPKHHILNCFGMQPLFVNNGKIDESFLGTIYRQGTANNRTGVMQQFNKWRIGDENDFILKNSFHISNADREIVNLLLNNRTFTFKQNGSLDNLLQKENLHKLKEIILMHMKRIKYYTMMCMGNFIITSHKDLYYSSLINLCEVKDVNHYYVDESILPKNVVIIGHSNYNSFRTPYVACPLFDKQKFDDLCEMNGINLNDFNEINPKKTYPLTNKWLNYYSLYQSYLDNVDVPYWYIETFNNPVKTRQKAYYTTLFFD